MTEPKRTTQPSWAGGDAIELGARQRRLGEPAVLGAFAVVILLDVLTLAAVGFALIFLFHGHGTPGNVLCRNPQFCYADPVPTIDTAHLELTVFVTVLVGSMVASILRRHGVIVVVLCQTTLLVALLVYALPNLSAAEHRQHALQACAYGVAGSCPGIVNLQR
jgi:F0F1-type ATP synthase membrane subunit c/vacuolar-type H+-ATPase subunit K